MIAPKSDSLVGRMKLSTSNGADVHFLVWDGDKKRHFAGIFLLLLDYPLTVCPSLADCPSLTDCPMTNWALTDSQYPYKAKGMIVLKIEKVSEYARDDVIDHRLSEAVYIRGLPWKISTTSDALFNRFGFYLRCNDENTDSNWSCAGTPTVRIVSQKEGKKDHTRVLMEPKNGWYDAKNDTVILSAEVTAEEPIGVE
uniref:MATH domain-containing protein n=1 Tax=Globodera rostochiensis TaxID=31243 RepID=A0A914I2D1_GLORO